MKVPFSNARRLIIPGGNQFADPFAIGAVAGTLYPFVAAQNTKTPGKNFVINVKTISERTNLQFRTELFNVLNHPQYLNPGARRHSMWIQRRRREVSPPVTCRRTQRLVLLPARAIRARFNLV